MNNASLFTLNQMKKIYFFGVLFSVSLISCTSIKQLSNQEILTKQNCEISKMDSKLIYYDLKIDERVQKMIFDTGANMSVITDSLAIINYEQKKFGALGTVTGADGKETDLKTFTAKLESNLFESENKVFAFIPRSLTKCQKKEEFVGILGLDVFFKDNSILQLDFSSNKICNISNSQMNEIIKDNYFEIKSECRSKQIFVFLNIEGKEYRFKLDTGFAGTLVIPYEEKLNFTTFNSLTTIGGMYRTASSTTYGEEVFYENVPVKFNYNVLATKLLVSKTIKSQNIGLALIKGFDWIIDYNNEKVFIKRNNNIIDSNFNSNTFRYLVSEKDGKLLISTKQKQLKDYNLGDEIFSINSEKIVPENICQMQDLLNQTQDWSNLKIESIKVE